MTTRASNPATTHRLPRLLPGWLMLAALMSHQARADEAVPAVTAELGGAYSSLSAGQPDWRSVYLRAALADAQGATYLDLTQRQAFGEHAAVAAIGRAQDLTPDWVLSGFAAGSSGGHFTPHSKWDLLVARKLLADRSLLVNAGVSLAVNHGGYRDRTTQAYLTWYGPANTVLEGGLRWNVSQPGGVSGQRNWAALSWRPSAAWEGTLRAESGAEGWQVVQGGQPAAVGFHSNLLQAGGTHWFNAGQGWRLQAELYRNPNYRRHTLDLAYLVRF